MCGHEKFGAYSRSFTFVALARTIIEKIPKGNADIREQLRRAAFSIVLNIAEGLSKQLRAEKNRYYQIARGSSLAGGQRIRQRQRKRRGTGTKTKQFFSKDVYKAQSFRLPTAG